MAEHTPGPWIVVGSGFMVSTCANHKRCQAIDATRSGYTRDEDNANAHLIAAAPELLAALKEIAKGKGEFSRDPLEHASNTIDSMKAIANAAIAKAQGKEST